MSDYLYVIFSEQSNFSANMLCTSLASYLQVRHDEHIHLVIPRGGLNKAAVGFVEGDLGIPIHWIESYFWNGRRMLCKVEQLLELMIFLDDKDNVLMADSDVFYFCNPLNYVHKNVVGLGITSRYHHYRASVNAGIVLFFGAGAENQRAFVRRWIDWILHPSFAPFSLHVKAYPDWHCDQDMLIHAYRNIPAFEEEMGVLVEDLTYYYNFFPDVDQTPDALEIMREAYETKRYGVLHFKGDDLKRLMKESWFKDYKKVVED